MAWTVEGSIWERSRCSSWSRAPGVMNASSSEAKGVELEDDSDVFEGEKRDSASLEADEGVVDGDADAVDAMEAMAL